FRSSSVNLGGALMNIHFITSAHNSLSQRLWIELTQRGHLVSIGLATSEAAIRNDVAQHTPDLIIAPMLKVAIPFDIYSQYKCLIVHPGIRGDRGSASLDWAWMNHVAYWGVSILEATADFDAGPIWAAHEFPLDDPTLTKSSLYRNAVTEAVVRGVLEAVEQFESGQFKPEPLDYNKPGIHGCQRPPMRQNDRWIDWMHDSTETIARKIRAADSAPGVLDTLFGKAYFLYGAHEEDQLTGAPGQLLAQRDGAICRATVDGAIWITHLKARDDAEPDAYPLPTLAPPGGDDYTSERCVMAGIKLPAVRVLGAVAAKLPKSTLPIGATIDYRTYREIRYVERDLVGYLYFEFYNGAMSTEQCYRLREAFLLARSRPTRVIVLLGGKDFWSNGIHLNVIEAAANPALESWRNINAINDLIHEMLHTSSHLIIAGVRGNAGAGGAMLALAADYVYARAGVVFNSHYKGMGNLYGSEYWTYTLPRRVGAAKALELTEGCLPLGAESARAIGFLDDVFGQTPDKFEQILADRAWSLAQSGTVWRLLREKRERRLANEGIKPLASYRAEELKQMRVNFFGTDPAYHEARQRFVYKGKPAPRRPEVRSTQQA
ncbi:MAG: hydrogenase maturation protein, partial [Gammaproteobacteria bacterium]